MYCTAQVKCLPGNKISLKYLVIKLWNYMFYQFAERHQCRNKNYIYNFTKTNATQDNVIYKYDWNLEIHKECINRYNLMHTHVDCRSFEWEMLCRYMNEKCAIAKNLLISMNIIKNHVFDFFVLRYFKKEMCPRKFNYTPKTT